MPCPPALSCLHGFLGLPADFAPLADALAATCPGLAIDAPALWPDTALDLAAWAAAHRRRARPGAALLGYSMGGRLALTSFLHPDSPHAALIAVAAHPGGLDAVQRDERRQRDQQWSARFRTAPWGPLMAAWDAQEVFAGRAPTTPRRASDFDRAALAAALERWSLAAQGDLAPALAAERRPVLWVVGADDVRYRAITASLVARAPHLQVAVIPGAAHRVPWEQPARFADAVAAFLATVPAA